MVPTGTSGRSSGRGVAALAASRGGRLAGERVSVAARVRAARAAADRGAGGGGAPQRAVLFRSQAVRSVAARTVVRTAVLALAGLTVTGCMEVGSGPGQQPVGHASGVASPSAKASGAAGQGRVTGPSFTRSGPAGGLRGPQVRRRGPRSERPAVRWLR